MKYISTRKNKEVLNFKQVTLKGLASDGGLYVPIQWNSINANLANKKLTFQETAYEIINSFVGDTIENSHLNYLIEKSYSTFRKKEITPIRKIDSNNYLLELYHGPTLAFKDVALQFLGNTFERFLKNDKKKLTIIGATSGDTGSAAIDSVKKNKFVDIFILHPYKRVSDFQRKQMTTVNSDNVFNIAIKGTFDDCQDIIKRLFRDDQLNSSLNLGSINSINWTRIMAQISYYIFAYNKIKDTLGNNSLSFSVPTGNFGDAYAGYIAKEKFKIPINKIIIATNKNNILDRFFRTGIYKKDKVYRTISPSMDIQVASNFERLLFDLNSCNGKKINSIMESFKELGFIKVDKDCLNLCKKSFTSYSINEKDTKEKINSVYKKFNIVIDPHTAVGLKAASKYLDANNNDIVITLATAHPSKFTNSVSSILGFNPKLPNGYRDITNIDEDYIILENSYNLVKQYILENTNSKL
jgi:threonine synthase